MRRGVSSILWATLMLLLGCCVGLPGDVNSEWSTTGERRIRREWGGGGGGQYAVGDALLRSGAFYGVFYGMYGAAVGGGRGALLGWESVPSGASSAFGGGSSYSAGSFYGAELPSSENEDIPQPPRPRPPPPPPILSQLSSVFFTAALVDFDGRDLAGDPQQFEEFRDLYLDAIGRIPQLLNLQTYQGTVIHRVMLLDGVVPNIDTEMQFSDATEAQTFERVLQGLGGTNELGFGAVHFKYVSLDAPAWPPPDERLNDSPPPPSSPLKPPAPPPPTPPSPRDRPITTPPPPVANPTPRVTTTSQPAATAAIRRDGPLSSGGGISEGYEVPSSDVAFAVGSGQSSAWGDCVLDRFGGCCTPPALLDAKAECCENGAVDECGVCGGQGSTCSLVANVTVGLSAGISDGSSSRGLDRMLTAFKQSMNRLFNDHQLDAFEQLEVEHVVDRHSVLNATRLQSLMFVIHPVEDAGQSSPAVALPSRAVMMERLVNACAEKYTWRELTLVAYEGSWRIGVCGNGLCEVGEMEGSCPKDCPSQFPCPQPTHVAVGEAGVACAGRGACASASGTCICHDGYTGRFCEVCADGYLAVGGNCVPSAEMNFSSEASSLHPPGNSARPVTSASPAPHSTTPESTASRRPSPSTADDEALSGRQHQPGFSDAGLIIGIVVGAFSGVLLGLVAVGGVAYWVVSRKDERRRSDHEQAAERGGVQQDPLPQPDDVPPLQAAFTATPWPSSPARPSAVTGTGGGGWGGLSGREGPAITRPRRPGMAQLYSAGTWPDVPPPAPQPEPGDVELSEGPSHPPPSDVTDEQACRKTEMSDDMEGEMRHQSSENGDNKFEGSSSWTACLPGTSRKAGSIAKAAAAALKTTSSTKPSTAKWEARRRGGDTGARHRATTKPAIAALSVDAATETGHSDNDENNKCVTTATGAQTDLPVTEGFKVVRNPLADEDLGFRDDSASENSVRRGDVGTGSVMAAAGTQTISVATVATMTEAGVSPLGNDDANRSSFKSGNTTRRVSATGGRAVGLLRSEPVVKGISCQTDENIDSAAQHFSSSDPPQRLAAPSTSYARDNSRLPPAERWISPHPQLMPTGFDEAGAVRGLQSDDFGVRIDPTWRDGELCIRPSGKQQAPVTINVTLHHHSHSGAHYHYQSATGFSETDDTAVGAQQPWSSGTAGAAPSSSQSRQRHPLQQPGAGSNNSTHKPVRNA